MADSPEVAQCLAQLEEAREILERAQGPRVDWNARFAAVNFQARDILEGYAFFWGWSAFLGVSRWENKTWCEQRFRQCKMGALSWEMFTDTARRHRVDCFLPVYAAARDYARANFSSGDDMRAMFVQDAEFSSLLRERNILDFVLMCLDKDDAIDAAVEAEDAELRRAREIDPTVPLFGRRPKRARGCRKPPRRAPPRAPPR